jgi:pimeloyl-ACP methyl ester carboxylesterase
VRATRTRSKGRLSGGRLARHGRVAPDLARSLHAAAFARGVPAMPRLYLHSAQGFTPLDQRSVSCWNPVLVCCGGWSRRGLRGAGNHRLWRHVLSSLVPGGSSADGAPVFSADTHHTNCLDATATALLDSLPPGRVSVVGHSLGGYLAMAMLRKAAPGRIDRLALISSQPRADSPAIQQRRRDLMAEVRLSGPLAAISAPAALLGEAQRSDAALWSAVETMAREVGEERLISGCTAAMGRADSRDTLGGIAAEAITPLAATREMSRLIPHAKLHVLRGCGHMAPLERPQEVTSALVDFLTAAK